MTFNDVMTIGADLAAIATALVAILAFAQFHFSRRAKRLRLERFLRDAHAKPKPDDPDDRGQRTLLYLSATLGMTETEIMDAAFRSRRIVREIVPAISGFAAKLTLVYSENP